ncbi:MAG: Gfo/Idh/MocA family protein [Halobacteriales archaeon]
MTGNLRAGVIGAGSLGTGLGEAMQDRPGADVIALADVSEENRARAGQRLDVPAASCYEDYKAMLDAGGLDAVMIATPHALHYDQAVAAMQRDLHVLCEKPLTTDLADGRDLVGRDESRDEIFQVGYQRHIEGPFVAARDRIAEFDDPPAFVTAEITQNWIQHASGTWRTDPDLSGGGQLYDTGSHVIDAVLWTTGLEPTAVTASMVFWDEDPSVDIQATLTVEFAEDAVATIAVSGDSPVVREHHRYWGDDGGVYIDGRGWNDRETHFVDPDGAERFPGVADTYSNKVAAFVDSIREGTGSVATPRHALAVTAVTEAAYESAKTGERVELDLHPVGRNG